MNLSFTGKHFPSYRQWQLTCPLTSGMSKSTVSKPQIDLCNKQLLKLNHLRNISHTGITTSLKTCLAEKEQHTDSSTETFSSVVSSIKFHTYRTKFTTNFTSEHNIFKNFYWTQFLSSKEDRNTISPGCHQDPAPSVYLHTEKKKSCICNDHLYIFKPIMITYK